MDAKGNEHIGARSLFCYNKKVLLVKNKQYFALLFFRFTEIGVACGRRSTIACD